MMTEVAPGSCGTSIPRACVARAAKPVQKKPYRFREAGRSRLKVWHCKACAQAYTLYSGAIFARRHLVPPKVVLLSIHPGIGSTYQYVMSSRLDKTI